MIYNSIYLFNYIMGLFLWSLPLIFTLFACDLDKYIHYNTFNLFAVGLLNGEKKEVRK